MTHRVCHRERAILRAECYKGWCPSSASVTQIFSRHGRAGWRAKQASALGPRSGVAAVAVSDGLQRVCGVRMTCDERTGVRRPNGWRGSVEVDAPSGVGFNVRGARERRAEEKRSRVLCGLSCSCNY